MNSKSKHVAGGIFSVFMAVFCFNAPVYAQDLYWACGDQFRWDSQGVAGGCWATVPGGVGSVIQPQQGDDVFVTKTGTGGMTVQYWNTNFPTDTLNSLLIESVGGGFVTLSHASNHNLSTLTETIGDRGNGQVVQTAGTHIATNGLILGVQPNSSGIFSVSNTGNLVTGGILAGQSGFGSLLISSGGTVSSTGALLGVSGGGGGTAELSGAGSSWAISGGLTVGSSGRGNLFIEQGGSVSSASGEVGARSGSRGTVTVTGADANWTINGDLAVGGSTFSSGEGILSIENGGTVSNLAGSLFGGNPNTFAIVDGVGSSWINNGDLNILGSTLDVINGASVLSASGFLDAGSVIVDGAGSTWTNSVDLHLVSGELNIINGGAVTSINGFLAESATRPANVLVNGAGSVWATNNLYVGGNSTASVGTGVLEINNGGIVNVASALRIWNTGTLAINDGAVNINGAGPSMLNGNVSVGLLGELVATNATVSIAGTYNNGGLLQSDSSAVVNLSAGLSMGNAITKATQGGAISVQDGAGIIGGFVEADGAGSMIDVQAGGVVSNAILQAFNGGALNIDGTVNGGSVRAIFGGSLTGNGTINASVFNGNGGAVGPGNSPGIMNIVGDYSQDHNSSLLIEIGGLLQAVEYDWLDVAGTATLGGVLDVSLFDFGTGLFEPSLGDSFDILTADTIVGEFDRLTLALLGGGLKWDVNYILDDIGTDFVRLSVSQVPIPSALWLLGSGLVGLIGIARRKKS